MGKSVNGFLLYIHWVVIAVFKICCYKNKVKALINMDSENVA